MKVYTDRKTAPLKFHKFLIWFSLPLGVLVSLVNAMRYVSAGYPADIFFFFDMGYQLLLISLTVLSIIGLWRYHRSGPLLLYARQALSICYCFLAILIFNAYNLPTSELSSDLSRGITWLVIFVIYYQKRMPLFSGDQSSGSITEIPFSLRVKLFLVKIFAPNSLTAHTMKTLNQPGNEFMRDAFYQTHMEAEKFSHPLVLTGNLIDDVRNVRERKDYYAKQVNTSQEMLDFGAIKESEKDSFLRHLQDDLENLQEVSLIWSAIMPLDEEDLGPHILTQSELQQARDIQSRIQQKYHTFLSCGEAIAALGNVSSQDPELRLLKSKESRLRDDMEQLVEDLGAIYYP